jgi:hypothetical protein
MAFLILQVCYLILLLDLCIKANNLRFAVNDMGLGITSNLGQDSTDMLRYNTKSSKLLDLTSCLFCREAGELIYRYLKCSSATYCNIEYYRAD